MALALFEETSGCPPSIMGSTRKLLDIASSHITERNEAGFSSNGTIRSQFDPKVILASGSWMVSASYLPDIER